jgi:hypothetical protein
MVGRSDEGSTSKLLKLCGGYFLFYVIYTVAVKYLKGPAADGFLGMSDLAVTAYTTIGGSAFSLLLVFAMRWYRLASNRLVKVGPFTVPSEYAYIIPSGICTAVIVPTTTLMYSLPISVMVAMVIMRGSVIVISRTVDEIQLRQGILKKKVLFEENLAVVFALLGVGTAVVTNYVTGAPAGKPAKDALTMGAGVVILASYIAAYALRIYIMNYFKNTRGKGVKLDNEGFFGVEQIATSAAMLLIGLFLFFALPPLGVGGVHVEGFRQSFLSVPSAWYWAILAGGVFGAVAVFSVFIFMFQGRTATFTGLVNRLTSLIAGTAATLLFALFFGGAYPKLEDWLSLGAILAAVACLTSAERRRALLAAPAKAAGAEGKAA